MVFDGKALAKKIGEDLVESGKLVGKSLVIFSCKAESRSAGQLGESTYVRLKREQGEKLGVKVRVELGITSNELRERLKRKIDEDGVLVQLPIEGANKKETEEILGLVPVEKDVDGLNPASNFQPAVVKAVEKVFTEIRVTPANSLAVVGAKGMVGKRLVTRFGILGFRNIGEFDLDDDLNKLHDYWVVVSATGQAGLIKPEMLREGAVAVDLGYPKGDFDQSVNEKVSFITPVPGGVGPVTIVCLFENLAAT